MVLRVFRASWRGACFSVKWSLVCLGACALFYNYMLKWNVATAIVIVGFPLLFGVFDALTSRAPIREP